MRQAQRRFQENEKKFLTLAVVAILTTLFLLRIAIVPGDAALSTRGEVWMSGVDPIAAQSFHWPNPDRKDYVEMLSSDAAWPRAASIVKVIKVNSGFVLKAPDSVLTQIFAELKRRHIELGVEMGLLARSERCGVSVEGYDAPGMYDLVAKKILRLGGDLRYLAMDEPLWFAHQYNGPHACHAAIGDVAREVAKAIVLLKSTFPEIQVGDIEPVGTPDVVNWMADIVEWTQAYRDAVGVSLPFFHADVVWSGVWQNELSSLGSRLHAQGTRFGIIYNGDGQNNSDEAWTQLAERHFEEVETGLRLIPDDAILQSWMPYPTHMIPETQLGTMTNLAIRYAASDSIMRVQRKDDRVTGSLADGAGKPVTGARIRVTAVDNGRTALHSSMQIQGTVPADAATAIIALRINTECNCVGPAQVEFGSLQYQDLTTGQVVSRSLGRIPERRIVVGAGEPLGQNASAIQVIPGDLYMLKGSAQVSYDSRGSGYVAIIFQNRNGVQIANNHWWFQPSTAEVGNVTTDKQGLFSVTPQRDIIGLGASYLVDFIGDNSHRAASAFVP